MADGFDVEAEAAEEIADGVDAEPGAAEGVADGLDVEAEMVEGVADGADAESGAAEEVEEGAGAAGAAVWAEGCESVGVRRFATDRESVLVFDWASARSLVRAGSR